MKYALIIGAKSDIAKALAHTFASKDYSLYLAGRNITELEDFKKDLSIRYNVNIELKEFDVVAFDTHQVFYDSLEVKPTVSILSSGYMNEQDICQNDFTEALNTINVNYTGCVSILNIIANDYELKKEGDIIGISSVAGDRGRKTNYIYGSSKAAFSSYLSGLRNRLFTSGVHVLTVKPGFVYTKMTEDLELPAKLTAQPQQIADAIYNAFTKKTNVLYSKSIWRIIMLIITNIPESIFKRLSI